MATDTTTQALLDAADAGDFERVRQLTQAGADLNAVFSVRQRTLSGAIVH